MAWNSTIGAGLVNPRLFVPFLAEAVASADSRDQLFVLNMVGINFMTRHQIGANEWLPPPFSLPFTSGWNLCIFMILVMIGEVMILVFQFDRARV